MDAYSTAPTWPAQLISMPNPLDILIDQQAKNRDANLRIARDLRDRGMPVMHVRRHVIKAREWNKELVRLKRELH